MLTYSNSFRWLTWLAAVVGIFLPAKFLPAGQWADERTIGPFNCYADFSLEKYTPLLEAVAGLQQDLTKMLRVGKPQSPIEIYLFQDKKSYRRFTMHFFPKAPLRRAMFVKRRSQCMVFAFLSSQLAGDLRHECTHAMLHSSLPFVPIWLDEGLAEYFELSKRERVYDNPYLRQVKLRRWFGSATKIEQLERIRQPADMDSGEYRDSWAWVHFMLHGSEAAHDELVAFLADIANESPPGQLSERLHRRIPGLHQTFTQHLKTWKR